MNEILVDDDDNANDEIVIINCLSEQYVHVYV